MEMRMRIQSIFMIITSLVALFLAIFSIIQVREVKKIALSEIKIEEKNSLISPVFDEETQRWSYVAVFEVGMTNTSGPDIRLNKIGKLTKDTGFLLALDGNTILNIDLHEKTFLVEPSLDQIKSNPKLLKTLGQKDMSVNKTVDLSLDYGTTKAVRFGVILHPYDDQNNLLARVVLLSYQFKFSNGKTGVFRRGFQLTPLRKE